MHTIPLSPFVLIVVFATSVLSPRVGQSQLMLQVNQSGEDVFLTWGTLPNRVYSLQATPSISPPLWVDILSTNGNGGVAAAHVRISEDGEAFFRIAETIPAGSGGAGLAAGGGSHSPSGFASSTVAATALQSPRIIPRGNGSAMVRYVSGWLDLTESDRPPVMSLISAPPQIHPAQERYFNLSSFLIYKPEGFGTNAAISISLPSGLQFAPGATVATDTWGKYPEITASNHYAYRFPMDDSLNVIDPGVIGLSVTSSNASFTLRGDTELVPPNNQSNSSPATIHVVQFRASPPLQINRMSMIDGRNPVVRVTINGIEFEVVIFILADPVQGAPEILNEPIDEARGTVHLATGEYSFPVRLFEGSGFGLNVQGVLSYSSALATWHRSLVEISNHSSLLAMPLGPGWFYPYGMRIDPVWLTYWADTNRRELSPPSNYITGYSFITSEGRVRFASFTESPFEPVVVDGVSYSKFFPVGEMKSDVAWGVFRNAVIVTNAAGYILAERNPASDGFTQIHFDLEGRLARVEPHGGAPALEVLYPAGQQIVRDSSGRETAFTFDPEGQVTRILDPAGGDWNASYSPGGALTAVWELGTGYGWEFAYDNTHYLLTERKLPHGFVVQVQYDTEAGSTNRLLWAGLKSTRWKDSPTTSLREIRYQDEFNPGGRYPDRVSITTPSRRNTLNFDLTDTHLLYSVGLNVEVARSDVDETTGASRPRGIDFYQHGSGVLVNTNAVGLRQITRSTGHYIAEITRPDGALYERLVNTNVQPVTIHSPTRENYWRTGVTYDFRYTNAGTVDERLTHVFPPGQSATVSTSKFIQITYDGFNRPETSSDLDGYISRSVYAPPPNAGLPAIEFRCFGEIPPGTTTEPNPWRHVREYDGLGRVTAARDPEKNGTQYIYDTAGRLVTILGPTNVSGYLTVPTTTIEYDGDLIRRITRQVGDSDSRVHVYAYDDRGRLIQMLEPGAQSALVPRLWQYQYDADGNLTNTISPNGANTVEIFDNRGRNTRQIGPEGEVTEYEYDVADRVTETRLIDGTAIRQWRVLSHDVLGRPVEMEMPAVTQAGITAHPRWRFVYDRAGNITQEIHLFAGHSRTNRFTYDLFDGVTRQRLDMGGGQEAEISFVRDHSGRITQAQGLRMNLVQSPGVPYIQPQQPVRTVPSVANYACGCFGKVNSVKDLSGDERLAFDFDLSAEMKRIKIPDPATNHTAGTIPATTLGLQRQLDPFGLASELSDSPGNGATLERNLVGDVTGVTDPAGIKETIRTTAAGDPSRVSVPLGSSSEASLDLTYDSNGDPVRLQSSGTGGFGTVIQYDRAGRATNTVSPDHRSTAAVYNKFGEIVREVLPSGARITYQRDGLGRITQTRYFTPAGVLTLSETTEYDRFGRLFALEDDFQRVEHDYDNLDRLLEKRTTFKQAGITRWVRYRWGEYGNLMLLEDSFGYRTEYTWNNEDNLTKILHVPPAGPSLELRPQYDRVGQLVGWTGLNGGVPQYSSVVTRDAKGRLKSLVNMGADADLLAVEYDYDNRDLRTNAFYPRRDLQASYTYDPRGFLTSETWRRSDGSVVHSEVIDYDTAGNRLRRDRNGVVSHFQYGRDSVLLAAKHDEFACMPGSAMGIVADSYHGAGYEPELAIDGMDPDAQEPGDGWRSSTNATAHWLELTLGQLRAIPGVDISFPTERGPVDGFNLEVFNESSGQFEARTPKLVLYGKWNAQSNLISTVGHKVRIVFPTPEVTRKIRILVPAGMAGRDTNGTPYRDVMINEVCIFQSAPRNVAFQYNSNGQLINDGAYQYTYDVIGNLVGVKGDGVDKRWVVGPDAMRIAEIDESTGATRYFLNDGGNPHAEFTMNGGIPELKLKHFNGLDLDAQLGFVEVDANGQSHSRWLVREGPGTVAQVLAANGTVLDDRVMNAWGEDILPPQRNTANPFGFAGAREDRNTGQSYFRTRMYAPTEGRFTSRDALGTVDGPNLYLYSFNNPVTLRDPTGTSWQSVGDAAGELSGVSDISLAFRAAHAEWNYGSKGYAVLYGVGGTVQAVDAVLSLVFGPIKAGVKTGVRRAAKSLGREAVEEGIEHAGRHAAGRTAMEIGSAAEKQAIRHAQELETIAAKYRHLRAQGIPRERARALMELGSVCFPAGTLVAGEHGPVSVEAVREGDYVFAQCERTGEIAPRKVARLFRTEASAITTVMLRQEHADGEILTDHEISCSPEHPIWVRDLGWVAAGHLVAGDTLETLQGGRAVVASASTVRTNLGMFNFEVDGWHTYFVLPSTNAMAILVHNTCANQARLRNAAGSVKRGNRYQLDGYDRISRAQGRITGRHPGRKKADISALERKDGQPCDHRGHLIAEGLVDNPRAVNLQHNIIAERGRVNLSGKKRFENIARDIAEAHPDDAVATVHEVRYSSPVAGLAESFSRRPVAVSHSVFVGGGFAYGVSLLNTPCP